MVARTLKMVLFSHVPSHECITALYNIAISTIIYGVVVERIFLE